MQLNDLVLMWHIRIRLFGRMHACRRSLVMSLRLSRTN